MSHRLDKGFENLVGGSIASADEAAYAAHEAAFKHKAEPNRRQYSQAVRPATSSFSMRRAWTWFLWVSAMVVLAVFTREHGAAGVLAGSLLVVLAALPSMARLKVDPLDAPGLYGLVSAMFFGVTSLFWLGDPVNPPPGIVQEDVSHALPLVAIGLLAFGVGARLVGPARPRPRLKVPSDSVSPRTLIGFLVLSAIGTVVGFAVGASGYQIDAGARSDRVLAISQVFTQFATIGSLVVLAGALAQFGSQRQLRPGLLMLLVGVEVVVGFAAGFKGMALLPVILTGLAYVSCRGRVPWRALALTAVFTLVVLIPANGIYRLQIQNAANYPDQSVSTIALYSLGYAGSRFRHIDGVSLIDARTPELYAYGSGRRYLYLPALVLIPRALWVSKPVLDDGQEFSHTYWEIPTDRRTSTPITPVGDLLRNFGIVAVPIGMLIWGAVIGAFAALARRLRSPRAEMVYLLGLIAWVVNVESDLPQLVAGASKTMLVAVLVAALMMPGRGGAAGHERIGRWVRSRLRPRSADQARGLSATDMQL